MKKKQPNKQPRAQAQPSVTRSSFSGRVLDDFFERYGLATYLTLASVIIILVFKDFISLEKVYLFKDIGSDSINIFYPYMVHISDYLREEGIPKWSFNVGLGQNIYLFEMGNPFDVALYLMGAENLAYGFVFTEIAKIFLSGICIYYYLKTLNISSFLSLVGALVYSFGGYMILGGTGWYAHSAEAFYASFFLLGMERFISRNQWYMLSLGVFVIGCIHSFFLFSYSIFFLCYFSVRLAERKELGFKKLFSRGGVAAGAFLLGVLMSSAFVINYVQLIYNSPRVTGSSSAFDTYLSKSVFALAEPIEYVSFLMRLFSNDLTGNGDHFKGWENYLESPILYIGLPSLLFFGHFFTKRDPYRRKVYLICTVFVLMAVIFPFFRYAFWGFGLNYFRTFSFFISLYIFFIAMRGAQEINEQGRAGWIRVVSSLLVCLVILFADYSVKEYIVDKNMRAVITILLMLYSLLIYLMGTKSIRSFAKAAFLFLLCFELIYFSRATIIKRDAMRETELTSKTGYNDYTVDAIEYLNKTDKGFYRVNKRYSSGLAKHGSMNDGMVQGYRGLTCYSSFNQKYFIEFLQGLNVMSKGNSNEAKWSNGLMTRPVLQSIVATKYMLAKPDSMPEDSMMYKKIRDFGNVQLFEHRTFIPLGIPYNRYIPASDFDKFSNAMKDISLLNAVVISDTDKEKLAGMEKMNPADTLKSFLWNDFYGTVNGHRENALKLETFSSNRIEGKISLEKKQLLFFSIPFDKGWKLTVDGIETPLMIVNYGLMGAVLEKGGHAVSLTYSPPFMKAGAVVSFSSILLFSGMVFLGRRRGKVSES